MVWKICAIWCFVAQHSWKWSGKWEEKAELTKIYLILFFKGLNDKKSWRRPHRRWEMRSEDDFAHNHARRNISAFEDLVKMNRMSWVRIIGSTFGCLQLWPRKGWKIGGLKRGAEIYSSTITQGGFAPPALWPTLKSGKSVSPTCLWDYRWGILLSPDDVTWMGEFRSLLR